MTRDREALVALFIDIDLLDSNAAWTALAEFSAAAYGRRATFTPDGDLVQVALTN